MFTTLSPVTPSTQLRINTSCPSPGTVRVAVIGEIDLSTTDLLRARLLNVLSALHPDRVEVDLGGVTFMDCGGLTVLIVAGKVAARTGCQLRITNPRPIVRRVLDLTGLLGVLSAGFGEAPLAATAADVTASVGILVAA
jgi:anti-anti-sigma factor